MTPREFATTEAIVRAIFAHLEIMGFVIVPREPTDEMCEEGYHAQPDVEFRSTAAVWRAMINAAPK